MPPVRRRPREDRARERRAPLRDRLSVARLDYVKPGSSADADRVYAEVQRLGRPVLNLYAELGNQPEALAAFLSMSRYVREESSLEPRLRELLILATARELEQEYEIAHHTAAACRAGVPEEKINRS